MKKATMILASAGLVLCACQSGAPQLGKASIDKVMKAMTLEEKAHFVIGTGMAGASGNGAVVGSTDLLLPGAAGTTYAIPRLGIPAIVLALRACASSRPARVTTTPIIALTSLSALSSPPLGTRNWSSR